MHVSAAALSAEESRGSVRCATGREDDPARLDRDREQGGRPLLGAVSGTRSELLSGLRSRGGDGAGRPAQAGWTNWIAASRQLAFRNPCRRAGRSRASSLRTFRRASSSCRSTCSPPIAAAASPCSPASLACVPTTTVSKVFRKNKPSAPESVVVDYTNDAEFRAALKALPCCVTNEDGSRNGDPLNLIVIGGLEDAFPALIRRGWSPTETTWRGSVLRIMKSALARERYPYAPISNLYLYGRSAGHCTTEGSRQHSPAQPSSPLAQSDALPRQVWSGWGRSVATSAAA